MIDVSDMHSLGTDLVRGAQGLAPQAALAVGQSTHDAERYAKALCPVESGELRNSISASVRGFEGEVTAGTDHGEYVEDGTSEMAPQPFMGPALARSTGPLVARFEDIAGSLL